MLTKLQKKPEATAESFNCAVTYLAYDLVTYKRVVGKIIAELSHLEAVDAIVKNAFGFITSEQKKWAREVGPPAPSQALMLCIILLRQLFKHEATQLEHILKT